MLSYVSVYPQEGPHVTVTHDALDLTVQGPQDLHSLLVTSGGHHGDLFKIVHFRTPTSADIY